MSLNTPIHTLRMTIKPYSMTKYRRKEYSQILEVQLLFNIYTNNLF